MKQPSKWTYKIASIEYGVAGYLDDKFLGKTLGINLNTPENINIALMLCFEAINLGIMNNPMQNPLCGVTFVRQYPELVNTILDQHPEYFVDGHILKATLLNASDYAPELLGENVAANGSYNAYLETIMTPIIEDRLTASALKHVYDIIKSGKWDLSTQNQLVTYANNDFLIGVGKIYNSALGQNLSTLNDALNISRILIFKVILDAITDSGSKNYAPVEVFAENYKGVISRILSDHPEYIKHPHLIDICRQVLVSKPLHEVVIGDPIQVKLEVPVIEEGEVIDPTQANLEVQILGEGEAVLIVN